MACSQGKPVLRLPAALQPDKRCQPCNALQGAGDEYIWPAGRKCLCRLIPAFQEQLLSSIQPHGSIGQHVSEKTL